jgi:membrane-bound lytic murein transglycosylase D
MVSRRKESSREYLPALGGQTIVPPRHMVDAFTLWHPLSARERRRIDTILPPEDSARLHALSGKHPWLPESERNIMESYLYRLTVGHADVTRRSLERASAYLHMIRAVLEEKGLPMELASLPLLESAFETRAVSPAGAAGLWQLMPATARRFGLEVSKDRDERFDPGKATYAATDYLVRLYNRFGDWPLALTAYNCGEGAMERALSQCGGGSLSRLINWCRTEGGAGTLQEETLRFVPQFVAAVRVMSAEWKWTSQAPMTKKEKIVVPVMAPKGGVERGEIDGRPRILIPSAVDGQAGQHRVFSGGTVPSMRRLPNTSGSAAGEP